MSTLKGGEQNPSVLHQQWNNPFETGRKWISENYYYVNDLNDLFPDINIGFITF